MELHISHLGSDGDELPEELRPHIHGEASIQRFTSPFGNTPGVFAVHFGAGARTRPHVHRSGQVLHIASGEGIVADDTGRHVVRPGDVVTVMPDQWHWHGGTPDSSMSHFTVQVTTPGDIVWDVDERDWAEGY